MWGFETSKKHVTCPQNKGEAPKWVVGFPLEKTHSENKLWISSMFSSTLFTTATTNPGHRRGFCTMDIHSVFPLRRFFLKKNFFLDVFHFSLFSFFICFRVSFFLIFDCFFFFFSFLLDWYSSLLFFSFVFFFPKKTFCFIFQSSEQTLKPEKSSKCSNRKNDDFAILGSRWTWNSEWPI